MSLPSLPSQRRSPAPAFGLVGLLGVTGLSHDAIPSFYDAIVPHAIPESTAARDHQSTAIWTLAGNTATENTAATVVPRRRVRGRATAAPP
jgi:hypothetical protein